MPGRSASCWSTTAAATARPPSPQTPRWPRRATTPRCRCRGRDLPRGMDRQAVGAGAGHSACHGRGRCHRLFPADRRRHRPCARQPQPPRRARRAGRPRPGLADGRAVLRDPGRALPHSGLRLLLPDALSVRLGRASAIAATAAAAGGCMLVRRDALERAGGIAAIRSEIIDDCALARRLKGQGPIWLGLTRRADELAALRRLPEDRPHDLAFGLRPARLFAARACRHRGRHGAGLHRAAAARAVVPTGRRAGWDCAPGW